MGLPPSGSLLRHKAEIMPYRILMIAPTSFFSDYGGHIRILEEARVLRKLGQQIRIVTYYKGRDVDDLDIVRTQPTPWHADYEVGSSRHKFAFDLLLLWKSLTIALRDRPDVIHAHMHEGALIGSIVARLTGAPMVFDFQGSLTSEMIDHRFLRRGGWRYRAFRQIEDAVNHAAPLILASSRNAADLLASEFQVDPVRVQAVPDCVNVDVFRPRQASDEADVAALKAQWGIPADRVVVAYLGLLAPYQGTDLLLEAAHILGRVRSDVHFLIMGFPHVDRYRMKAVELGVADHVTFTGKVNYEDAPRYLRMGDVAVAPKLSETEGCGKLLNYMACALPTVAFDTPVSREYLGEHGIYAATGNAEALAAAILQFVVAPEHGCALGQWLRARVVERFSWDDSGARLLNAYEAVIAQRAQRAPQTRARSAAQTKSQISNLK
jgi:glycosyltransferase involved in cell wall biosynthesis